MDNAAQFEQLQDTVRTSSRLRVVGGGTKTAQSHGGNVSLGELSGILEYDPSEYTFTALAGTPVAEVQQRLAEHGQYLPFDPMLVESGATLGGTVASGLSGSGRYRYGGVRDFLLGVRLIAGTGEVIYGGGKVVKNAAGFDIPKLMVGSLGQFGVLLEMTMKVFPAPEVTATLIVETPDMEEATRLGQQLFVSPLDLTCLDFEPPGRVLIRIAGMRDAIDERVKRALDLMGGLGSTTAIDDDASIWSALREFRWVSADHDVLKIPLRPAQVILLEKELAEVGDEPARRYSVGGNLAYVSWPRSHSRDDLEGILNRVGQPAVAIRGDWDVPFVGPQRGRLFADRLRSVFDPEGKFRYASNGVTESS